MASSSGRNYVPLGSVKTYREGFLRLQGWMIFSALAFFTAGILVMYEVGVRQSVCECGQCVASHRQRQHITSCQAPSCT